MPLVRIDVVEGRSEEELRELADAVQEIMEEVFIAPKRDRYQIIHEHKPGRIIAEDTGLGFGRTEDLIIIQVTHQGPNEAQKKALYAGLADRLQERTGLAPSVSTPGRKRLWNYITQRARSEACRLYACIPRLQRRPGHTPGR